MSKLDFMSKFKPETRCIKKFGAIKFNYLIMMMKDYFVHYHTFPRYDKDVNLFDIEWKDNDWPGAINFKGGIEPMRKN